MMANSAETLIKGMLKSGIRMLVHPHGVPRCHPVEFRDAAGVLAYLKDPRKGIAEGYGCSVEHYEAWCRFKNDYQCTGTTRQGRRCKNGVVPGDSLTPDQFKPGDTDRCDVHKEFG